MCANDDCLEIKRPIHAKIKGTSTTFLVNVILLNILLSTNVKSIVYVI